MNPSYLLPPSVILARPGARDLSELCCAIPGHATHGSRRVTIRRDLTPALVSWMFACLEEILYDETNTERHIFRRAAVVGQRLHRMLQTGWSRRWAAEAHQDAGHSAVPEPQSAIQSRAAVHLRRDRRGDPPLAFAQRRFHARGRGCGDDRRD